MQVGEENDLHSIKSLPTFGAFLWRLLGATAITRVWASSLFYTSWALAITLIYKYHSTEVAISNAFMGVLGVLISFVVSLRANSGYERYIEARKLWANLGQASRTFATIVWIHLRDEKIDELPEDEQETAKMRLMLEKRQILNLVVGFAYAMKHALRHESGPFYEDLFPYLAALPKWSSHIAHEGDPHAHDVATIWHSATDPNGSIVLPYGANDIGLDALGPDTPSTPAPPTPYKDNAASSPSSYFASSPLYRLPSAAPARKYQIDLLPAFAPPRRTLYDVVPALYVLRPLFHAVFRITQSAEEAQAHELRKRVKLRQILDSNVPLEIALHLSAFIASAERKFYIPRGYSSGLFAALNLMTQAFSDCERILLTPLPYSYRMHLRFVVYVYLLCLPFQLVEIFGWLTPLGVFLTSLFFLGFIACGSVLENPFQYDPSDLNLDLFCSIIAADVAEVAAHVPHDAAEWLDDPLNRPFAAMGDPRTARQILAQPADAASGRSRLAGLQRDLTTAYVHEMRSRVTATRKNLRRRHRARLDVYAAANRPDDVRAEPLSHRDVWR